jgi:two-component system sensor histidine kinase DesK
MTDRPVAAVSRLRGWFAPAPDSVVASHVRRGKSPWTDAIHLLWSAWVFVTPLLGGHYSWRWAALTLASYPLFLLLYARTLLAPRRRAWIHPLAMVAMAFALLPWYPSGLSYFVFGCVMLHAGQRGTLPRYLLHLLLLNAALALVATWVGYPWQVLAWMLPMTLIIGVIVNVEAAAAEKDLALQLSQDEVRRLAASAERERIGRDLHDLLGHTLSLITLKLELARKLSDRDPAASMRELEEAERVARHALAEVRSAVSGIRSTDLAAELASARLLLESSRAHLEYGPPPADLPPDIEKALALVLREAATNIARHARAARVQVAFVREAKAVRLCVHDDGIGGVAADGNGLAGMRDRVRALGGSMEIASPRGQGTRLLVRVPLPAAGVLPTMATEAAVAPAATSASAATLPQPSA